MIKTNLNKKEISKNFQNVSGLSFSLSIKLIDELIDIYINNIKSGNLIIKNIGSFNLIEKKQRMGRNPKTKENFLISKRKSISFSASKKLINLTNK